MATVTLPNGDRVLKGSVFDPGSSNYIGGSTNSSNSQSMPSDRSPSSNGGYSGGGGSWYSSPAQDYASQLQAAQNAAAEAERIARQQALNAALQGNTQALNSQKSTVANSYNSAINQLNATKESQLPQYQAQRDQASADANAQLRRTQALNALTGKYHSGTNRTQQLAVDLAKQNAIAGYNQAENEFTTSMANQLSDVEAQRVAALNDIADKLSLVNQQYSQGTLSLNNEIESKKASAAAQAMADAMVWANQMQQQGVDNSYRQDLLNLQNKQFDAEQYWKEQQFGSDQEAAALQRALALAGLTGYYEGTPTFDREQFNADQAYRNASLNSKSSSSSNLSEIKYLNEQNSKQAMAQAMQGLEGLANGSLTNGKRYTRGEILNYIINNSRDLAANGIDIQELYNWAADKYTWEG